MQGNKSSCKDQITLKLQVQGQQYEATGQCTTVFEDKQLAPDFRGAG